MLTSFFSIVFVSALGIFGYLLYQSNQDNQKLVAKIDALEAQVTTLNSKNNSAPAMINPTQIVSKSPSVSQNNLPTTPSADPMVRIQAMREQMHKQMQSMFGNHGMDAFFNDDFFKDHLKPFNTSHQNPLAIFSGTQGLAYDIQEKDHNYVIEFSSPNKDDLNLNIEVKNGSLLVKEEKKNETTKQEKENFFSSRTYSSSSFSIPLPKDADSNFKTKMQDGKLLIILPKVASTA
jgi:HSP20 family molecular chaperone IbpA